MGAASAEAVEAEVAEVVVASAVGVDVGEASKAREVALGGVVGVSRLRTVYVAFCSKLLSNNYCFS